MEQPQNNGTRKPQRIVVKLGSRVLTAADGQLNNARVAALVQDIAGLWQQYPRVQVTLVSSGAVNLGPM
jgi:glutamate 5-kinase